MKLLRWSLISHMCQCSRNPYLTDSPFWIQQEYRAFECDDIQSFHRSIPGYQPTPLVRLPALAERLGVAELSIKDESHRLGLKAFKAMGASYAIYRFIKQRWERQLGVQFEAANLFDPGAISQLDLRPFCTATDGNHGRAVAWFSRLTGQRAVIYIPTGTVRARIDNIRGEGAQVTVIDGDYDETVRRMATDAERNGWHVISDTSYPGYTQIPAWIMAGYTTMFREITEARLMSGHRHHFTHVFVQAGVGSFAASAAWYYTHQDCRPNLVAVEPTQADCLMASIRHGDGQPQVSRGNSQTIMAGLNCGTPSLIAWPLIRDSYSLFLTISDDYVKKAMRQYYYPEGADSRIISGESGAAGLAAVLALLENKNLIRAKQDLNLNSDSRVLLFNTEGDTDPENFATIVN
ncbi:MAG: diaminopropionate ammonia-lyase [Candidatus Zixiibacteriota bacterium]|nr:MAG: diaminopropionate ammonia-lyase [candidate division Zixibacteria bacterium]